jgi:hypothetical protein
MKSNGYYTPGNPKRERKITREWYERCWRKAFTDTEIIAIIKALPPDKIVEGIFKFLPKEIVGKLDNTVNVKLILSGMENRPIELKGETVEHLALPPGVIDSD